MTETRPPVTVRPARPEDAEVMLALIEALADYEKLDPPDAAARERLIQDAFGPKPRFQVLLAEVGPVEGEENVSSAPGPRVVGYAFTFETYSTFLALPTLYLEDLFVLPDCRGLGAGKALFEAVVAEADRRGCGRVEWVVLDWNQLARDFYARYGGKHLDDWCYYRLRREQFGEILGKK